MFRKLLLIIILTSGALISQQRSDPFQFPFQMGIHNGNRVGISFYDDGHIADFRQGIDIRGEWPLGSGENYIGDCIPLIGMEFVNRKNDTIHSVIIPRGPRRGQSVLTEGHPKKSYFWGWNPRPGFRNEKPDIGKETPAMSHIPYSWPQIAWNDPVAKDWKDENGKPQWFGYFGRGIIQADQESLYEADDQWDDEFNFVNNDENQGVLFLPDSTDPTRHGMGLKMRVRGFQWANFLAEDCIFWLYDIQNESTTIYSKAVFGTVVGTLAGGDGDSGDDLAIFDPLNWVTYSYDNPPYIGNRGQKVGFVGYAFLESPGNPFDGIDNDDDSQNEAASRFVKEDFAAKKYNAGDKVVLINIKNTNGSTEYERVLHTVKAPADTVYSMNQKFIINPNTQFREGNIARIDRGVAIPAPTALDGIDNDLDGIIDENEAAHFETRVNRRLPDNTISPIPALKYKNYVTGAGVNDPLIDERRDNNIDENSNWDVNYDDVGIDGVGPRDDNYTGPDFGEGNGVPDQGEPNFGRTDPNESDQIGLTGFNFFNQSISPDLSVDTLVWNRMLPGRFDIISPEPQDGDFIYSSGYFPLVPSNGNPDVKERFSVALLFGEDYQDIVGNKDIVQQVYDNGYKFPQPPYKPTITLTQEDGKVVIYWDGRITESSRDFITKKQDFQGYKIYRATDASFQDARVVTDANGYLTFDRPIAQFDLVDTVKGFFYPTPKMLDQVGGTTFYLGNNTGVTNRFIDSTVTKGITYYYAVCAYDHGETALDIFPAENSKFLRRSATGEIVTDLNTGFITPGVRPAGYKDARIADIQKSVGFIGTGSIQLEFVDDQAIREGFQYKIAFQDTGAQGNTINWSLIDLQTPDTVFIPLDGSTHIVKPLEVLAIPAGEDTILVNGARKAVNGTYTAPYDSLVARSIFFAGNTPIRHGFRVQLYNDAVVKLDTSKSGFFGIADTNNPTYNFSVLRDMTYPQNNGFGLPTNYKIEFSASNVATSIADTLAPKQRPSNVHPAVEVPFKVLNTSKNEYVNFSYWKSGTVLTTHNILLYENVNGKKTRTWKIDITYKGTNIALPKQGYLQLSSLRPFNHNDEITFTMKAAEIDKVLAGNELDKIKVVPNPYIVTNESESRLLSTQLSGRGERKVRFTHVPPNSTISIYTVRGERVRTLSHDNLYVGDVYWNLRTDENLDVAYGVYVYVVETQGVGTKVGKLALIK